MFKGIVVWGMYSKYGGDEMAYHNVIPLEKFSFRYRYFCFVDVKEYLADALFMKHKVRVWFRKEAQKPNNNYVFIFCKVKKGEEGKFLEALEELKNKMLLMGYLDYQKFCEDFFGKMILE